MIPDASIKKTNINIEIKSKKQAKSKHPTDKNKTSEEKVTQLKEKIPAVRRNKVPKPHLTRTKAETFAKVYSPENGKFIIKRFKDATQDEYVECLNDLSDDLLNSSSLLVRVAQIDFENDSYSTFKAFTKTHKKEFEQFDQLFFTSTKIINTLSKLMTSDEILEKDTLRIPLQKAITSQKNLSKCKEEYQLLYIKKMVAEQEFNQKIMELKLEDNNSDKISNNNEIVNLKIEFLKACNAILEFESKEYLKAKNDLLHQGLSSKELNKILKSQLKTNPLYKNLNPSVVKASIKRELESRKSHFDYVQSLKNLDDFR